MVSFRRHAGNWLAYIACGGLVLVGWFWKLQWKQKHNSEGKDRAPNYQPQPPKLKPPSHRYKHYDHPSEEQHRTAEQFNWRDTKTLNVGIAIAAVAAALFAFLTYCEVKRQADDGHASLIFSQAAFVYGNPPTSQIAVGQSPPSFVFLVPIGNSGATPTRRLKYNIACRFAEKFRQIDIAYKAGRSVSGTLLLGPKAEIPQVGCQVPISDLIRYKSTNQSLFIFGQDTYFDVFRTDYIHVTEFCYSMAFAEVQQTMFHAFINSCPTHNCADQECQDYDSQPKEPL